LPDILYFSAALKEILSFSFEAEFLDILVAQQVGFAIELVQYG
jgi:hypothetical protein